jgi:hypothetical protein
VAAESLERVFALTRAAEQGWGRDEDDPPQVSCATLRDATLARRTPHDALSRVDRLKNVRQIEHSRHRSPTNFLVHLLAGLAADCHQPKKPSLRLDLRSLIPA